MIEEFVQFFVGVVDAQLLERVNGKIFETENIQNAQEPGGILARIGADVYMVHQPGEGPRVQSFGHSVPVFFSLIGEHKV